MLVGMNSSKVAEGKTNTSSGGGSYFSTIFGSSLDHYHQPAAATTSSSVGAKPKNEMNPNDIPPDELLQLCMKLNKRMQTLETKHNELVQKYKVVNQEKISLFDLLKSSIDNPPDSLEDISALQEVWTHQQEEEKVHIRKLEEEIKSLKLSQTDHSHSESSQSPVDLEQQSSQLQRALQELQEAHLEVHKAHQIEKNLRNSISNLELTSLEKNQRIEELEKLFEAEKAAREEDLVFFRLQQMKSDKGAVVDDVKTVAELSEAKQKILLQEGELEERRQRIESLLEQTRQYEKRMLTLESDANRYKEKLKEFEKNSGATTLLKAEQEALLNSLRRELKNALSAKEDLARHVKDLEAYRGRAEGQLVKLVEYKEKALAVEENLIEAQALNSRLQSQLQTVETNHALKTAMLATVEAEIESLKDLNLKSKQEYEKKLGILESKHRELRESNERVSVVVQEKEAIINSLRQEILVLNESHLNEMRVSQETHSKEVQDLMRESSKKSATAATLISEREKEIADLRSKVSSLKDEIASGSPSERKIFELAQSQANREATIGASM